LTRRRRRRRRGEEEKGKRYLTENGPQRGKPESQVGIVTLKLVIIVTK